MWNVWNLYGIYATTAKKSLKRKTYVEVSVLSYTCMKTL